MTILKYRIAGIGYEISGTESIVADQFKDIVNDASDISIRMESSRNIEIKPHKPLLNDGIMWTKRDDGGYSLYVQNVKTRDILSSMDVDKHWNSSIISYNPDLCSEDYALNGPLGEIMFRNHILYKDGIVMHAAAVEWQGHGIVFTAPSGTGKSTQANLWKVHKGARVINGDRPALKMEDGRMLVYGTPWSGAKPEFLNIKAPVSAIVVLKQAPDNTIKRLSQEESLLNLLPRLFLPYYDNEMMNIATSFLEKIISSTPVYMLECRPDIGAVELVEKCLM